jgi:hypothetical protein
MGDLYINKTPNKMKTRIVLGYSLAFFSQIIFLTAFTSCNSGSKKQRDLSQEFKLQAQKADGFYVISSSTDDSHAPRSIEYLFNGTITNRGGNIYADARIFIKLYLELNNGQLLDEKKLTENSLGFDDILASQSISQFMPGDTRDINRLVSVSVPIAYINYPIQRVLVDFDMETEDQVNNNKDAALILEKDLTTSWKKAAQRAKAGFADADEYNDVDKIIGR